MSSLLKQEKVSFAICISLLMLLTKAFSQCVDQTISLTSITDKITFNDFSELTGGITINAVYVNVSAPTVGCAFDLYVDNATLTNINPYSAQGIDLPLSSVNVRAFNSCQTPNHDYGAGSPPCTFDLTRICGTFNNPLIVGGDNYIIGSSGGIPSDDGILLQTAGACAGIENINDEGTSTTTPTTHKFRLDLQITPGIAPVITPGFYVLNIDFVIIDDDRTGAIIPVTYTLEIDIQPILQMKMTSADQLDFVFSDIRKYVSGITNYGSTIIQLSSNMNWDLLAYGTSTDNENTAGGNPYWDVNLNYSASGGSNQVPLYVLELHQSPQNPFASGAGVDYSPSFPPAPFACSDNFIEVAHQAAGSIVFTLNPCNGDMGDKTVAGNWDGGAGGNFMAPGTYTPDLVAPVGEWDPADFRYVFDYRLVPGLPATFNGAMGNYVRPGSYTMQVRYLLYEDQ